MVRNLLAILAISAIGACGSDVGPGDGPPRAIFELPREAEHAFFDLPWPTDLRRTADGHIDVSAFHGYQQARLVTNYVDRITARISGYGTNSAAYLRFSRPLDPSTLPVDPASSAGAGASVFIINVDDESPDRGSRHPVLFHFQEEATVFWPANTLAVQPVHGMPLTTGTRYALVATDALLSRDGEAFNQDTDLEAVLAGGGDDAVMEAIGLYAPAIAALEEFGVPGESILSLAVFTTQDPVSGLLAARDWVVESYPAPEADARAWRWVRNEDAFALVHGEYGPSPILQAGEVPYPESGGQIEFEAGAPILQGEFNPRFALTVPLTEQPEAGFPIVLYAHGTGGDWQSFIRSDVAARLGELGYAVMGVDQIHHGPRNPTEQSPEGLFFNIINPDAARDNSRQSAIDVVQQARLVSGLEVPNTILAGGPIRFDAERVYFYGHSQGGINGPLFLAIDDQAQGGVLSGAGAVLSIAIIDKTEPIDIATLAGVLLHLGSGGPEEEALVYSHPIITLVQTWLEVSDTANYAHLIFHEPRPGFAPKTILQTEGVNDEFTPPASIEALATATRIPLIEPIIREVPGLTLRGLSPQASGASLNVAGGMATAGLVQLDGGHFVAFREEDGERIVQDFFSSLLEGPPSVRTGVE